jgi:hypothetical protein
MGLLWRTEQNRRLRMLVFCVLRLTVTCYTTLYQMIDWLIDGRVDCRYSTVQYLYSTYGGKEEESSSRPPAYTDYKTDVIILATLSLSRWREETSECIGWRLASRRRLKGRDVRRETCCERDEVDCRVFCAKEKGIGIGIGIGILITGCHNCNQSVPPSKNLHRLIDR